MAGKIFAIHGQDGLVVKLSKERVVALKTSGTGREWGPGTGRIMKEWVEIPSVESRLWQSIVQEAREFVGGTKRLRGKGGAATPGGRKS